MCLYCNIDRSLLVRLGYRSGNTLDKKSPSCSFKPAVVGDTILSYSSRSSPSAKLNSITDWGRTTKVILYEAFEFYMYGASRPFLLYDNLVQVCGVLCMGPLVYVIPTIHGCALTCYVFALPKCNMFFSKPRLITRSIMYAKNIMTNMMFTIYEHERYTCICLLPLYNSGFLLLLSLDFPGKLRL